MKLWSIRAALAFLAKSRPIQVIVYFADPKDIWAWQVDKIAVLYTAELRFPWMRFARMVARSNQGNTGNTGYIIQDAETGDHIEHVPPARPWVTGS